MTTDGEEGSKGARKGAPEPTSQTRRAFLTTAVLGTVATLAAEALAWWRPKAWSPESVVTVSGASDLGVGEATAFTVPGTDVPGLLVRLSQQEWIAVDRRCPHLGCPVVWDTQQQRFACPCHRASFAGRDGAVLSGPPREGLRRLAVENHGDRIRVRDGAAAFAENAVA